MVGLSENVRSKIAKAKEFLLLADVAVSSDCWDAGCSLSASAAINASDALIINAGGLLPAREEHVRAVRTLSSAVDASAGRQLQTALKNKSKSQYNSERCNEKEARDALKAASRLVDQAKKVDSDE